MLKIPLILILGAFGGLLNHLYFHNNTLAIPQLVKEDNKHVLNLGFFAEILLGAGGALIATFLLAETGTNFQQTAISLLGGFGGGSLLAQNVANLERQRASAFKEISEGGIRAVTRHSPKTLTTKPSELSTLLLKLESAQTNRQIQKLKAEALFLLKSL